MKKCELCNSVARMYCESDQGALCFACDYRVHKANFIVAKHTRTLLCQACQCMTPWTGSGSKLSLTVSVCESCVGRKNLGNESNVDDEDEDEDGENQVVPTSSNANEMLQSDQVMRKKNGQSGRVVLD